jgi:hypothetical protein
MATFQPTGALERSLFPRTSYSQFASVFFLLIACAVVILGIVLQNYYVLAIPPAVLLLIKYPVELPLGVFAFLIPFDSVLMLGQSGHTLTWLTGAAAGGILLAYGVLSGRLTAPPRAALWWGLFILWGAASLLWALDPGQALERLPTALLLFLLYLVVVSFRISERAFFPALRSLSPARTPIPTTLRIASYCRWPWLWAASSPRELCSSAAECWSRR